MGNGQPAYLAIWLKKTLDFRIDQAAVPAMFTWSRMTSGLSKSTGVEDALNDHASRILTETVVIRSGDFPPTLATLT